MKPGPIALDICLSLSFVNCSTNQRVSSTHQEVQLTKVQAVKVNDPFWSPKFDLWRTTTANDVLDKFEAKNVPPCATAPKQRLRQF